MRIPPEKANCLISKIRGNMETAGLILELKKMAEAQDRTFGKFCDILNFLKENIPDEKKLYRTAVKTLLTASELTRQDVLKSANGQLDELRIIEDELTASLTELCNEIKTKESRLHEISEEIAILKEKLAGLELEEQKIVNEIAEREKETALAAKALGKVFVEIRNEITGIKTKLETFTNGEAATTEAVQLKPAPQDLSKTVLPAAASEQSGEAGKTVEMQGGRSAKIQKTCPHCGSKLNFFLNEKKWMCYVCAYEEYEEAKSCDIRENIALSSSAEEPSMISPSHPVKKKNCPVCKKKMNWHEADKTWRCSSCEYHRMEI